MKQMYSLFSEEVVLRCSAVSVVEITNAVAEFQSSACRDSVVRKLKSVGLIVELRHTLSFKENMQSHCV